jgi:hypothetical protein
MGDIENDCEDDNDGINERWMMSPHRCITSLVLIIVTTQNGEIICDVLSVCDNVSGIIKKMMTSTNPREKIRLAMVSVVIILHTERSIFKIEELRKECG